MTQLARFAAQMGDVDACSAKLSPLPLPAAEGDVHIWRAPLTASEGYVSRMARTLSRDEHARAERFRWSEDHRRFVIGRGLLHAVMAAYLRRAPASLTFRHGAAGKPGLRRDDNGPDLRFNVSRSGDLALIAVDGPATAPRRWSVSALDVGNGYVAALAIDGREPQLREFRARRRSIDAIPERARGATLLRAEGRRRSRSGA